MKHTFIALATALLCGGAFLQAADAPATRPEAGFKAETSQKLGWSFKPDPALSNVLILGDSISIGYTLQVRKLLAGKANVFRPVSSDGKRPMNCEGTTLGLQQIDSWLTGHKWSVIHFNWGLHDLKHVTAVDRTKNSNKPSDPCQASVEEYSRNLEILVGKLKATGARLIFATTTPVVQGTTNPLREADAPARYNTAALKIMQAHAIEVNDLYAVSKPQLAKIQLPRNVHFKPNGSQTLAQLVAGTIEAALDKTKTP